MSALARTVALGPDLSIPQLGLGVFQVPAEEAQQVVEQALEAGYRHIDTAAAYVNESGVGAALRASGLPREDVFVTSKLRNGDQGFDAARRAYARSCTQLGLEYLDLYLIHWPNPEAALWQDSWRALENLAQTGALRAAGVSNFLVEHLEELTAFAGLPPAVNQVELHPTFQQEDVVQWCQSRDIAVEAYSPLGQGTDLEHPTIAGIADELGLSAAQVVLRWHLEKGHIVIPKTVSPARMRTNAELDVALTPQQISAIDALESGQRTGNDPRTFALSQIR